LKALNEAKAKKDKILFDAEVAYKNFKEGRMAKRAELLAQ
jgi:hypothetical protein